MTNNGDAGGFIDFTNASGQLKNQNISIQGVDLAIACLKLPYKHTVQCDPARKEGYLVVFSSPTQDAPVSEQVSRLYVFTDTATDGEVYFAMEHGTLVQGTKYLSRREFRKLLLDGIKMNFALKKTVFDCTNAAIKERKETQAARRRYPDKEGIGPLLSDIYDDKKMQNQTCMSMLNNSLASKDLLVTEFENSRLRKCDDSHFLKGDTEAKVMTIESGAPTKVMQHNKEKARRKEMRDVMINGDVEIPLAQLLVNVFGAADEDNECVLAHYEVQQVCEATLMDAKIGLMKSDIRILLSTAHENEEGYIEYRPFVAHVSKIVDILRKRRLNFEAKREGICEPSVPWEEVIQLYLGDEIEETARCVMKYLDLIAGIQNIYQCQRSQLRRALTGSRRFTAYEILILMQMIPPGKKDDPNDYDAFAEIQKIITEFRLEILKNPLVETDIPTIECYVNLKLKQILDADHSEQEKYPDHHTTISIWHCKRVLMNLEHINLSLYHVHALLCILETDMYGFVDCTYFVKEACRFIPSFFNIKNITISALECAKEKADALAARELRELQEFQGKQQGALNDGDEDEDEEDLEKTLVQFFQISDRFSGERGFLEVKKFMKLSKDNLKANHGFTTQEVRGFIAHADINQNGEIQFTEHIREVVPLVQAFRRCKYLHELVHGIASVQ